MLYAEGRKVGPHPINHDAQKAGQPVIVFPVQSASWGILIAREETGLGALR